MSTLPYHHQPDAINAGNMQVWNNAAFDDAEDGGSISAGRPLRSISLNKENHNPIISKPLESKTAIKTPALRKTSSAKVVHFKIGVDVLPGNYERSIDDEIEDIEKEIKSLSSRLEVLKLKKAERDLRVAMEERRGRIVAARFKDPKPNQSTPSRDSNKIEDTPVSAKFRRRGLSLGPLEITPLQSAKNRRKSCFLRNPSFKEEDEEKNESVAVNARSLKIGSTKKTAEQPSQASKNRGNVVDVRKRRGLSVGPVEIASAASTTIRRRETEVQEKKGEKVTTAKKKVGRRRSLSVSPKSGKLISKISQLRKGIETVGGSSNKSVKKDMIALKPKALFQEEEGGDDKKKALATKRVMKGGRTVSSRYSIITQPPESKRRKWSWPEKEDTEETNEMKKSPAAASLEESNGNNKQGLEEDEKGNADMKSPVYRSLPKIQTCRRFVPESPRDSGAVKRAVEVIGRRSHFGGLMESFSSSQGLSFEEDDEMQQQLRDTTTTTTTTTTTDSDE